MTRYLRAAVVFASVGAAVIGLTATSAHAASGTVSFANGAIRYVAEPGRANVITISVLLAPIGSPNIVVIDDVFAMNVPVVRGGVCRHPVATDRTLVHCKHRDGERHHRVRRRQRHHRRRGRPEHRPPDRRVRLGHRVHE
jgi:hypothetical protein